MSRGWPPRKLGEEVRINVESLIGQMRYGPHYYGFVVTALPYPSVGRAPLI